MTSHKEIINTLHRAFVGNIKFHFTFNEVETLEFKNPFRIWVSESIFEDEGRVPYTAIGLLSDGTVVGKSEIDEEEFQLESLDIYEIAHILDILNNKEYKILEKM